MIADLHVEPRAFFVFFLLWTAGVLAAAQVFQADLNRRKIRANAYWITLLSSLVALAAARFALYFGAAAFAATLVWFLMVAVLAPREKTSTIEVLDSASLAAATVTVVIRLGILFWHLISPAFLEGAPASEGSFALQFYFFLVWAGITFILWWMSLRAARGPKPKGEIFSVYLALAGAARLIGGLFGRRPSITHAFLDFQLMSLFTFLVGSILLAYILRKYHGLSREHRILQHVAARGDTLQPEYSKATPECPHPERWHMYDSMTAEVEVLDFLKTLVTTMKPELVVETGTFLGASTLRIAEGLRENSFGRVITCENDAKVYEEAKKRFAESGLADWIDLRNETSLKLKVEGRIDLLYCDSDLPLREQEVRRFLPQVNPNGLVLMHDASSNLETVREAAQKLEREGLLSVVFLPTPRGLVIGQKREGRI